VPYQSIITNNCQIKGRRPDILERTNYINTDNKSMLDLGCNLGIQLFLTKSTEKTGVEYNQQVIDAACRLCNVYQQNINFIKHDLNEPLNLGKFDVVLALSIIAHVKNKNILIDTILNSVKEILYFEGHSGSKEEDYKDLFKHFKKVELLTHMHDGIHCGTKTRPLFKCEI
jgi:2-polyprenyl-3-methyl-5-hydroxy-6-metoxy-1,4-benzoquinol methylase